MSSLSRTSSGLLLADDFSTNTKANYTESGGEAVYWNVASGLFTYGSVGAVSTMRRADLTTAKCATHRASQVSNSSYYESPIGVGGAGVGQDNFACGYVARCFGSHTAVHICKYSPSFNDLKTCATPERTPDEFYLWRMYISDGVVYLKEGATALGDIDSVADATFTQGHICFMGYATISMDWVEARTSHEVACTDLPTGYWLRVTDGTTSAKAESASGTAVVDAGRVLFPLARVSVYNGDPDDGGTEQRYLTISDLADMGGGDVFAFEEGAKWAVTGTVAASAGASGSIAARRVVTGHVVATSSAAGGSAHFRRCVSGVATAVSVVSGAVARCRPVSGYVHAFASVAGATAIRRRVTGCVLASAAAAGALVARFSVTAKVSAVSGLTGQVGARFHVTGAIRALSGAVGRVGARRPISGIVGAVSSLRGAVFGALVAGVGLTSHGTHRLALAIGAVRGLVSKGTTRGVR